MNRRTLHRWMSALALAAALSLSLLPAAGRVLGGESDHAAHAAPAGESGPALSATQDGKRHPAPVPAAATDADCGYCPLLTSVIPSPRPDPAAAPGVRSVGLAGSMVEPRVRHRHPAGLGSRGPPGS